MVHEDEGHHGLDDGRCPDADAGVVAAGRYHLHLVAVDVEAAARFGDARCGLEGDPGDDVLAGRNAAKDTAGVVAEEAGRVALVAMLAAALLHRREAGADLHALGGVDAHERTREFRVQLAEHRFAQPHRHVGRLHGDRRAHRVAIAPQRLDHAGDGVDCVRVRAEERICIHGVHVHRLKAQSSDLGEVASYGDAGAFRKVFAGDAAGRNAHRRFPRRSPAAAAIIAPSVLTAVGVVGMSRAVLFGNGAVVPRALVHVVDGKTDGGAGGDPFKYPREDSHLIRLPPLRGIARLPRTATIQVALQVRFAKLEPRRTAIHHRAKRRPVALAKGGDAERLPKRVASHSDPLSVGQGGSPHRRSLRLLRFPPKGGVIREAGPSDHRLRRSWREGILPSLAPQARPWSPAARCA